MRRAIAVALACTAGCAITSNTMLVGSERARRDVDTIVCVEVSPGVCARTALVGRQTPDRSFGGGGVVVPIGYAHVRGSTEPHQLLGGVHAEYLRGRGGLAIGARAGVNGITGDHDRLWSLPVTLLGYWGVPGFSVFGGGGYTPYARATGTYHGPNVLAGTRWVLMSSKGGERVTTSFELSYSALGELSITGATISFGLHL